MIRPTTVNEDQSFWKRFVEETNTDVSWILAWVRENFRVDEVFGRLDIEEYVLSEYSPERLYGAGELEEWALDNGFVREE